MSNASSDTNGLSHSESLRNSSSWNNLDAIISRDATDNGLDQQDKILETLDVVINCYVIHVVSILGIVGNLLNIVVLTKLKGMSESTKILLMSLSVVDLFYVVTTPVRRIYCIFSNFDPIMTKNLAAFDRVYLAVANRLIGIISASHIVLISLERTFAVFLPFTVSQIFSVPRTKVYVTITYLFWIALISPFFFAYEYAKQFDDALNQTIFRPKLTKFYLDNADSLQWLNSMVLSNIRGPVCIFIVSLCSILIGFRLRQASIKRATISSSRSSGVDLKVVKMLLVVSLVYLSIGIPVHVPYIYFQLNPDEILRGSDLSPLYYALTEYVSDLFYAVNSSVNFVIYVTMSESFQNAYRQVVKCKK